MYATAPVHLGDTSFRRKEIIEHSQAIMRSLLTFVGAGGEWDRDGQREFYDLLRMQAPEVFRGAGDTDSAARERRARTNTNPLKKLGFTDAERRPTPLGLAFARSDARLLDDFDRNCRLKPENAAVLRGLLGYGAATDTGEVFFPVRLLIRLLVRLGPLTAGEFGLGFIIGPELIGVDEEALAAEILAMRQGELDLEEYLSGSGRGFTPAERAFISHGSLSGDVFPNRKSPQSVAGYREFVDALTAFRAGPAPATLARLRTAISTARTSIRDRFDPAEFLPALRSRTATPAQVFGACRYPGFDGDDEDFRRGLVQTAQRTRTRTLVKEYQDNNLRILAATGVFSVGDGVVRIGSAYARAFFATVADRMPLTAPDEPGAAARAQGLVASFGADALTRTNEAIAADHGIDPSEVQAFVDRQELARFDEIVSAAFGPDTVLGWLRRLGENHQDPSLADDLERAFHGKASVPCIYEYLVGLSFYYASGRAFDPRSAFGLSLDGDFLPISHAPGGRGDIEFVFDDRQVLIEVTLMDPGNQRRAELEPVLRHATNLACEHPRRQTVTVFVANEVDPNVARIFGFARVMALSPTRADGPGASATPLIVSLSTREWTGLADTVDLHTFFDEIAAEAGRVDVDYLNSDWNAALLRRLRG
ncbi:MAG: AlwI family type II restriction endonuclease [Gordonia sp. (in: high G+C Gram-positive bacteria)]|uniref:AlwI family type II restriction endonuclease n=1 Tax=Gordonia sp. (in: high G+C Gram-positive bacteria) TaxID=84139 RepID=UPI0039E21ADB